MSKVIVTKSKIDAVNDAISLKSGTATSRTLDDMVTDIGNIPAGTPLPPLTDPASASDILDGKEAIDGQGQVLTGTAPYNILPSATTLSSVFYGATINTDKINLDVPYAASLSSVFRNANFTQSNTEVVINAPSNKFFVDSFNSNNANRGNLKKVTILSGTSSVTDFVRMFNQCIGLVEVDCDFDLSATPRVIETNNMFDFCSALQKVRFVPNTTPWLSSNAIRYSPLLTDESIISLANGLKDGVTGQTLTLHATPKARTLAIMGTVSQVTEEGVTYNFFTADEQGTTSLNAFITTIKGWTLA